MSIFILNKSEELVNVIPISRTKGCSVDLITVRKAHVAITNPLTVILKSLPDHVRTHSNRSAVIAKMLAGQAENLPDGMDRQTFAHTVWLGCLYHHLGEQVLKENLSSANFYGDIDENMLLSIVSHYCERFDGSGPNNLCGNQIPLATRLVGLADVLDNTLIMNKGNATQENVPMCERIQKTAQYIQENGAALFGNDAMTCFKQIQEEIFNLYLNQYKRTR